MAVPLDLTTTASVLGALGVGTLLGKLLEERNQQSKERRAYRRQLLETCRKHVWSDQFDPKAFKDRPEYKYLRPHLVEHARDAFERPTHYLAEPPGLHSNPYREAIAAALQELERRWRLS